MHQTRGNAPDDPTLPGRNGIVTRFRSVSKAAASRFSLPSGLPTRSCRSPTSKGSRQNLKSHTQDLYKIGWLTDNLNSTIVILKTARLAMTVEARGFRNAFTTAAFDVQDYSRGACALQEIGASEILPDSFHCKGCIGPATDGGAFGEAFGYGRLECARMGHCGGAAPQPKPKERCRVESVALLGWPILSLHRVL